MNIYLTRHGETLWNKKGKIQGFLDSPLTEKGIADSISLRDRLADIPVDICFTSNQNRAIATGKIIMEVQKGIHETTDDLKELGVGIWQGMYYKDIIEKYPEDFHIYTTAAHLYIPKNGGEDYSVLEKRVKNFIDKLKKSDYKNVVIVTHGVTQMMLLNLFENKTLKELCNRGVPSGGSLSKIVYKDNKFEIVYENCMNHL